MNKLQLALSENFKANSQSFVGWDVEMIVDYYVQSGVTLTRGQIETAIGYTGL